MRSFSSAATICAAIGEALKRHNVASISRVTGLRRESLYKSLSSSRRYHNPNLETVTLLLSAMGFRLQVERLNRSTTLRSKSKLRDEVRVPAPRRKKGDNLELSQSNKTPAISCRGFAGPGSPLREM